LCGSAEIGIKKIVVHWGSATGADPPRSEPEADLLPEKPNRNENKAFRLEFLECDSKGWPVIIDDTPGIDVPREPRLRARLARDTASTTYIRRIGSMLGKGARLVRFQDSEKSEWRAMLRRKKHEGAAYSPLYVRLA
jgi:hypothetical protein